MSEQVVNGVPVKDMAQLMDAMKSEPEKGQGVYRSVTTWKV